MKMVFSIMVKNNESLNNYIIKIIILTNYIIVILNPELSDGDYCYYYLFLV